MLINARTFASRHWLGTAVGTLLSIWLLTLSVVLAAAERLTGEQVAALMPQLFKLHLSQREMDPPFMRRLVKQFVEQLDPTRSFYLKDEAEAIYNVPDKDLKNLATKALQGDLTHFRQIMTNFKDQQLKRDQALYEALEKRTLEIKARAKEQEDEDNKDDKEDEDKIKWNERPLTIPDREERVFRTAVALYQLNKTYLNEDDAVKMALQTLREERDKWKNADLNEEVPKLFLKSFMLALDPHTEYMDAEDEEEFNVRLERNFAGIGVQIRPCPLGAQIEEVIKGGPSEKSGKLKRGDQIIAVGSSSLAGLPINKIVRQIKGEKGTEVKLTILKADTKKTEIVSIVRDTIELAEMRVKGKTFDTPKGRIGLISVQAFYVGVHQDVRERLKELSKDKPLDGVVLDLRYNAGGYLEEAVGLTGLFIRTGPIVAEQDATRRVSWTRDDDPEIAYTGPLAVLVNQYSASASEIVAGALKDYGRAVVVGPTSTYGKGTVQRVIPLDALNLPGDIKITTHQYFLAGGDSVQLKGVEPDVVIPGPKLNEDEGMLERSTENAIPWRRVKSQLDKNQPDVKKWTAWKTANVVNLQQESTKRVANNPEFTEFNDPQKKKDKEESRKKLSERLKPDQPGLEEDKKDPQAEEAANIVADMVATWPKQ